VGLVSPFWLPLLLLLGSRWPPLLLLRSRACSRGGGGTTPASRWLLWAPLLGRPRAAAAGVSDATGAPGNPSRSSSAAAAAGLTATAAAPASPPAAAAASVGAPGRWLDAGGVLLPTGSASGYPLGGLQNSGASSSPSAVKPWPV
jgi:hypothetical protein